MIHFLSAVGGSAFMHEIIGVVADAVGACGADVTVGEGRYPMDDSVSTYVVIPHEYFVLTPEHERPSAAQMARTVALCVEHCGTLTFETSAQWAAQCGAAVDINHESTVEMNRRGIATERFVLGYSPRWDVWQGVAKDRPIDITYMGTTDPRRDRILGAQAAELACWRTELLIPPHEQMTRPRPDFLMGGEKLLHLASSSVLLNLHRGASTSLEWVRVLEAMCNGSVVVTERSTDHAPVVPGVHAAFARPEVVVDVASALLRHPQRLDAIRTAAYELCRERLSMAESAERLVALAERLKRGGASAAAARHVPAPAPTAIQGAGPPAPPLLAAAVEWGRDLPVVIRAATARRLVDGFPKFSVSRRRLGDSQEAHEADVDVVVTGSTDSIELDRTVASLVHQTNVTTAVAVATASVDRALGFPLGAIRNRLIKAGRADWIMVIDGGQELLDGALSRLLARARESEVAVVLPLMSDRSAGTIWNCWPPESDRLERTRYLGAPYLLRRTVWTSLGGYSVDAALVGYEDHELLTRLLANGYRGGVVRSILGLGCLASPPAAGPATLIPEFTRAALASAREPIAHGC